MSYQADLDRLFTDWDRPDTPGLAVVVVREGDIVYLRGYGSAHLEHGIPITPTTVFDVGSAAKQFTAFTVAMLSQAGELDLDADIRFYLGELPDFGQAITLRNLVHHTSGLWNWSALTQWLGQITTIDGVMRAIARQRTLNFDPGTEFQYCNTGYNLLARVVERVTGQSFREWTTAHLFLPLGMRDTFFQDCRAQVTENRAGGYIPSQDGGFDNAMEYHPVGSSALFTTAEDMACWLRNLDDGRVGGKAVLEQIRQTGELNNGERLHYAFGLFAGEYRGRQVIEHGGECRGYRSAVSYFPDSRFGLAVLANLKTIDVWGLARPISDICLFERLATGESASRSAERRAAQVDPAVYEAYTGQYLIEPGHILTILRDGDRLFWQITGQPRFELVPQSESEFLDKDGDPVSFHRDETGQVNQVTLIWEWGQPITAQRIVPSTHDQLYEYEGIYSSAELDTLYHIVLREHRLVAQNVRHADIPLAYYAPDQFAAEPWWFRQVDFVRSQAGRVAAFRLTTREGVKELTFAKSCEDDGPSPLVVEVRDLAPVRVAMIEFTGDYAKGEHSHEIGACFQEVRHWVASLGHDPNALLHVGIAKQERGRPIGYVCCVEVPVSVEGGSGRIRIQELAGGRYAVLTTDKAPSICGPIISRFYQEHVPQKGIEIDGTRPTYEIYYERTLEYCVPVV